MGRHTVNSTAPKARQIRHQLKQINPSNSHAQLQSPLFSTLPPGIRNQIFRLAVSQYDDSTALYEQHENKWYNDARYGIKFHISIHTDLLRTCRRVYYETRSIPMRSATHRLKLEYYGSEDAISWFSRLTAKNVDELDHVQFFINNEYFLHKVLQLPQCRPKRLTISVFRHYRDSPCEQLQGSVDFQRSRNSTGIAKFLENVQQLIGPAGRLAQLPNSLRSCVVEFEIRVPDLNTVEKTTETAIKRMDNQDGGSLLVRRDGSKLVRDKNSADIRRFAPDIKRVDQTFFIVKFTFALEK
jgi:hypothetical protein